MSALVDSAAAATWTFRGDESRRLGRDRRPFRYILQPMDLGTVRGKLVADTYGSVGAFHSDVELVYDNMIAYRRPSGSRAPLVLALHCPSRGRHQPSDAARTGRNGARTAERFVSAEYPRRTDVSAEYPRSRGVAATHLRGISTS